MFDRQVTSTYDEERLTDLKEHSATCVISLTETFTICEVVERLLAMVHSAKGKRLAVAFHINIGKFKASEQDKWSHLMRRLSKLFICLFVFRTLEDEESGLIFNFPPNGRLQAFIEMPDKRAHFEGESGVNHLHILTFSSEQFCGCWKCSV